MRVLLYSVLFFLLGATVPVWAGMTPEVRQALTKIESRAGSVDTLASSFIQEKHLEMFDEVMQSRGRFYFRQPDRLRWELLTPVATGFALNGNQGRRWHERTGQDESFDINSDPAMRLIASQLLAWTRLDLPWLDRNFEMTLEQSVPVVLRLMPTAEGADRFLAFLRIRFSNDQRHVTQVEVHEKDGDFTRIRFVDTQVNLALNEDLF